MKERSALEVEAVLEAERAELSKAISRQSFYCTGLELTVSPAHCHDCFESKPYTERMNRWNENRMRCVEANRAESLKIPDDPGYPQTSKKREGKRPSRHTVEGLYSIEEYLLRGLLEFLLDLDSLAERFDEWQGTLPDTVRARVHLSAELQESIVWFAERVADFRTALLEIGKPKQKRSNNVG